MSAPKVPTLRFREFEGEWEKTRLDEVAAKPQYGLNASAVPFDGRAKYVRITDIDDETRAYSPNPLCSPECGADASYRVNPGDLLFTRTGASTGKSYLYRESDGELYFAGFLIRFAVKEADPYFVFTQTLRRDFQKWVGIFSMRSGQPGINAEEYASYAFFAPRNLEQVKISSFLISLDERLLLLTRRRNAVKTYKEAIMQRVFSRTLRFTRADGSAFPEWQQKRFGALATFSKGRGISKDDLVERGATPCIRYAELYTIYGEIISDVDHATNESKAALLLSKSGDVIIPASGEAALEIGAAACVMREGVALGGDLNIVRSAMHGPFLARYLRHAKRRQIARLAQGNSVVHLYGTHLKQLEIAVPHIDEQRKIADFLADLDAKIHAVSAQISSARRFKKAMLQQMFV